MSEVARNLDERQEYWKPVEVERREAAPHAETCSTCGTGYPVGARFCYVCGMERSDMPGVAGPGWRVSRYLDVDELKSALGLSMASLVAFMLGLACVIAAAVTRFVYNPTTVLDWQAVEIWRVEWLLAAVAAFVAGVLLKR